MIVPERISLLQLISKSDLHEATVSWIWNRADILSGRASVKHPYVKTSSRGCMYPVSFFMMIQFERQKKIDSRKCFLLLSLFSRILFARPSWNTVSWKKDIWGCLRINFCWDWDMSNFSPEKDFGQLVVSYSGLHILLLDSSFPFWVQQLF